MKRSLLIVAPVLLSLYTAQAYTDDQYSVGIGIGVLYSGIGVYASWFSENNFRYVAAGCVVCRSSSDSTYGFGAGWLRTGIINPAVTNHGVGIYIGPVASEQANGGLETNYEVGAMYAYFPNGAVQRGFVFGIAPAVQFSEDYTGVSLDLSLGYQF